MNRCLSVSFFVALAASVAWSCSDDEVSTPDTPEARGRALLESTALSPSTTNRFACTTCHATEGDDGRLHPGAPLAGAPLRSTFWGGTEDDLLRSTNACLVSFMGSNAPLVSTDPRVHDVWAYLLTLPPTAAEPVPFTLQDAIVDLAAGDPARGREVFAAACKECHGELRTGEGRLYDRAPYLPDQTLVEHAYIDTRDRQRLLFIEKVRHGRFFNYTGSMPPFSKEVMNDADLGALLAYFEMYSP